MIRSSHLWLLCSEVRPRTTPCTVPCAERWCWPSWCRPRPSADSRCRKWCRRSRTRGRICGEGSWRAWDTRRTASRSRGSLRTAGWEGTGNWRTGLGFGYSVACRSCRTRGALWGPCDDLECHKNIVNIRRDQLFKMSKGSFLESFYRILLEDPSAERSFREILQGDPSGGSLWKILLEDPSGGSLWKILLEDPSGGPLWRILLEDPFWVSICTICLEDHFVWSFWGSFCMILFRDLSGEYFSGIPPENPPWGSLRRILLEDPSGESFLRIPLEDLYLGYSSEHTRIHWLLQILLF